MKEKILSGLKIGKDLYSVLHDLGITLDESNEEDVVEWAMEVHEADSSRSFEEVLGVTRSEYAQYMSGRTLEEIFEAKSAPRSIASSKA